MLEEDDLPAFVALFGISKATAASRVDPLQISIAYLYRSQSPEIFRGNPYKFQHIPNKIMRCTLLLCLSAILGLSSAFVAPSSRIAQSSRADTSLAPQFDPSTEKWEPSSDADLEGSYSAVGTLVRAGPKPFLIRLVNPGEYDQAVYKYMANENVGRKEAQGNMDAYVS